MGKISELTSVKVWAATTELRWIERDIPFDILNTQRVLQQKYVDIGRYGFPEEHEWRDVPTVKE